MSWVRFRPRMYYFKYLFIRDPARLMQTRLRCTSRFNHQISRKSHPTSTGMLPHHGPSQANHTESQLSLLSLPFFLFNLVLNIYFTIMFVYSFLFLLKSFFS